MNFGSAFQSWEGEQVAQYIRRMQQGPLPQWPSEVLSEWLYRHNNQIEDYAWLDFTAFRFTLVTMSTQDIPGRECFTHPSFCDAFSRKVEIRLQNPKHCKHDWLLNFMLERGTWPEPVVLLSNPKDTCNVRHFRPIRAPLHLLEGHRRLSIMQGLIAAGRVQETHQLWVVSLARPPSTNNAVRSEGERRDACHRRTMATARAPTPTEQQLLLQEYMRGLNAAELRKLEEELTAVADLSPSLDEPQGP